MPRATERKIPRLVQLANSIWVLMRAAKGGYTVVKARPRAVFARTRSPGYTKVRLH